jgi:hypothetical protein
MTSWFRSWHGAPTDNKWLVIARRANVAPGVVSAVAWALMDHASQAEERGSVAGFDVETYCAFSGFLEADVSAIVAAMRDKNVIDPDNRLTAWDKRQPKREDDSSERVRNWRAEHRNEDVTPLPNDVTQCNAQKRSVTHGNNTEQSRAETEQNRTETEAAAAAPPSLAWKAFTTARGINLSASDSTYIAELVELYSDEGVAQAIVYCDKNKRDNFLRLNYIQRVLSGWQAEGTLGLHTPEYDANRSNGNGKSTGSGGRGITNRPKSEADIEWEHGGGVGPWT